VVYEFLNTGGRRMSTSKGRGAAAHLVADVMPPEQLRFLFLRPRYNQAIDFDPDGTDAIPRLFDESDRLATAVAGHEVKGELPSDPEHVFSASQVDPEDDLVTAAAAYRPAFAHLAMLVQVPGVDVAERVAAEKGAPLTARERQILEERVTAARRWLEVYAPERVRIAVQREQLPAAARELDPDQRRMLEHLADALSNVGGSGWNGESVQAAIFDAAREQELQPNRAFAALYAAFLGQPHGPRAGWLLASLEPDFVIERLRQAAAADTLPA
jgi:lysyl-tRNA synthetase class 1